MAKGNRRFGPADRAVVVTALLGGATVAAAAKAAGFAVQTLHDDRRRCALFARAWADAVAESARPQLVARGTGGWWQLKRLRRNRFTRDRKEAFLGHLAATADVAASAVAAGVCRSTVYAHRERDPAFAKAWREALETGVAALEARLLAERHAALAAYCVVPAAEPPPVDPQERDLEFWRALHLLREHKYGLAGGRKAGRPPGRAPEAQVAASIVRLIGKLERRSARQRKWGTPSCEAA
jgi:hypothetical protein